jgi:hypothetical protein
MNGEVPGMHKQLFDDAIGEVPPSTVDVDAVITRGRRAARVRRVANPAVAAGVAVVLLTGAIAYTMTRGDGAGLGTPPPMTTTPPNRTTSVTPPRPPLDPTPPENCKIHDLETALALNVRLTSVVGQAFHQQRPDVQLSPNRGAMFPDGAQYGPFEFYQVNEKPGTNRPVCDVDSYSMARATTQAVEGGGNVLVVVAPSFHPQTSLECTGAEPVETFCDVVTGTFGDRVMLTSRRGEGGMLQNRVDIIRADGTSVIVQAENINTTGKSGDAPTATAPPLTLDQLQVIGTAPGMTLFP